jgi:hypoxanthine phosphoribosyltransferase
MQSSPDFELHVTGRGIELPWQTVETCAQAIRDQYHKDMYVPVRILALGKGAMIPARLLAKEKTPVYYVGVHSYIKQEQQQVICTQQFADGDYITSADWLDEPGTLIVDDLWDTGQTFEWAKERWPKAKTAALLSKKPAEETKVDYVGLVLPTASWIIFPWEK